MSESQHLKSAIEYASLLNYSPRGQSTIAVRSRNLVRDGVKNGHSNMMRDIGVLLEGHAFGELEDFFGSGTILVPIPRSTPLVEGGFWPSLRICEEIQKRNLAFATSICLERISPLRSACLSEPGNRPQPEEHLATITAKYNDDVAHQFLLVDDFVTRGSIITACGMLLKEAFPNSTVKAFAVVNTLGLGQTINQIVESQTGVIQYQNGNLNRGGWRDRILQEMNAKKSQPAL